MAKNNEVTLLDKIYETRMKHNFMLLAISELWGSEHSDYSTQENILGCQLLMDHIGDELEEIQEAVEKVMESDSTQKLKLVKKGA
jgi:hypothetical protein